MTKMISARQQVVHCSVGGATVSFPGGKNQVEVPDHLIRDCLAAGAVLAAGQKAPAELLTPPAEKKDLSPTERNDAVLSLIRELHANPNSVPRDAFAATGRPARAYIEKTLGINVTPKEIGKWWDEVVLAAAK